MSILKKPYEISIWEDQWDPNKNNGSGEARGGFVERKICTIGSNKMTSQSRVLEPNLTRNVNGVKKLSFKLYKKYVDTTTGEETINPFVDLLVAERKVKLKYGTYIDDSGESKDRWYDFIVKNISENSATHQYVYQLEDALVQELSKNGYGIILDEKQQNNIGTAKYLAETALCETDWSVESEAFVQRVEEALVYLETTKSFNVIKLVDQVDVYQGVTEIQDTIQSGTKVLAFYSSCTGKPHRFQFIRVGDLDSITTDENRIINNKDCQFYIDFSNPESDYKSENEYGFCLPNGFIVSSASETIGDTNESTTVVLSGKYRGNRYGFSQQAKYISVLDKYVYLYNKKDANGDYVQENESNKIYYGYENVKYCSPALATNLISGSNFESLSGWTGTRKEGGTGNKAIVENKFGRFESSKFIDSLEEIKSGNFDANNTSNKSYLSLQFPSGDSSIINSGPWDNRTLIGNMEVGSEWGLIVDGVGVDSLNFSLAEYTYDSTDCYKEYLETNSAGQEERRIVFSSKNETVGSGASQKTVKVWTVDKTNFSEKTFKKNSKLRLQITAGANTTCYIENISLFKIFRDKNNKIILPEEQGVSLDDRVMEKTYYYFTPNELEGIKDIDEFKPLEIKNTLNYATYVPVYNQGAQKVRSINVQESNYFNILQNIAETFEAWLELVVDRNDEGGIVNKRVLFKNYIGKNNYAGFKYGVNLKEIQRTKETKNIVTKLIVKQNNNQYGKNGFCTIARANANPTGETNIYDFQYFFNMGLLDPANYLNTLYKSDGAVGADVGVSGNTNLNGYFLRLKNLNNRIIENNEQLINIEQDITQYSAELEAALAGEESALEGMRQSKEDFSSLTLYEMGKTQLSNIGTMTSQTSKENAEANNGYYYEAPDWLSGKVGLAQSGENVTITFSAKSKEKYSRTFQIYMYPRYTINGITQNPELKTILILSPEESTHTETISLAPVDFSRSDVKKLVQEYALFASKAKSFSEEKTRLQTLLDGNNGLNHQKNSLISTIDTLKEQKRILNQLFFANYSRFIQEGTWMDEKYYDDELYYADALSVMYNSCYPQVAYNISVIAIDALPEYELFAFDLGDKTYVEDKEFFGDKYKEEVIVSELTENLDDPSKNTIKVQNFKNQFQDLFQKITATVQQAQYKSGSYEKAVALAEANQAQKQQFLTDALDGASARLSAAGQQSVTWGSDGITVKSVKSPCDAIRMVGGAILLSKQTETGEQKWVTGVTNDGISASLLTAGTINTGVISLMCGDEPAFRWDVHGISAFSYDNYESSIGSVVSNINSKKFVRFDKYGLYGIDGAEDGLNWHATSRAGETALQEIDNKSTFALTWEGLKVTGDEGVEVLIGKQQSGNTVEIKKGTNNLLSVDKEGNLSITGTITGSEIIGSTFKNLNNTFRIDDDGNIEGATITGSTFKNSNNTFSIDTDGNISGATITGGSIVIKNSLGSTLFSASSSNGKLTMNGSGEFSGTIDATDGSIGTWLLESTPPFDLYRDQHSGVLYSKDYGDSNIYGTENPGYGQKVFLTPQGIHLKSKSSINANYSDDFVSWAAILHCAANYVDRLQAYSYATGSPQKYGLDCVLQQDDGRGKGATGWIAHAKDFIGNRESLLFINGYLTYILDGDVEKLMKDEKYLGYGWCVSF